jgi:predicted HTH domain antitoxin
MTIELPDAEIKNLRLTPEQGRLEVAVGLYAGRQVTMGRGARIAGISSTEFMRELGRRGVCINYSEEDALQDIETVRQRIVK